MTPSPIESALIAYARRFPVRKGKMRLIETLWPLGAGADHMREAQLIYGGYRMPANLNEALQRQFYFFGTYFLERQNLDCWVNYARSAKVALDVGANAGIYSLAAASANPGIQVHAFEPTPEISERLTQGIALNGLERTIHVHECAISDTSGVATLKRFRGENDSNEGMNFIVHLEEGSTETVRTTSIDQFRAEQGLAQIDLIKIDIQGQEAPALMGAKRALEEGAIGVLFLELNWGDGPTSACSALDCIDILSGHRFLFSKPGPNPEWREGGPWLWPMSDVIARPRALISMAML